MRPRQSQDNKHGRFLKVLFQERSQCPLLQSKRETTGAGSHRSQPQPNQLTGAGKQQAWSVAPRDLGHTGAEKKQETTPAAHRAGLTRNQVCKHGSEAWAHIRPSGGIANHPRSTYTAPGLRSSKIVCYSRPSDFFPLSRRSQAVRELISDRLGIWHLPRLRSRSAPAWDRGGAFLRARMRVCGKIVCARGLGSRAHQLSRYLGESIASDLPEVCQQRVFSEGTKTARSGGTNSRISSPLWRRSSH